MRRVLMSGSWDLDVQIFMSMTQEYILAHNEIEIVTT